MVGVRLLIHAAAPAEALPRVGVASGRLVGIAYGVSSSIAAANGLSSFANAGLVAVRDGCITTASSAVARG